MVPSRTEWSGWDPARSTSQEGGRNNTGVSRVAKRTREEAVSVGVELSDLLADFAQASLRTEERLHVNATRVAFPKVVHRLHGLAVAFVAGKLLAHVPRLWCVFATRAERRHHVGRRHGASTRHYFRAKEMARFPRCSRSGLRPPAMAGTCFSQVVDRNAATRAPRSRRERGAARWRFAGGMAESRVTRERERE